MRPFQAPPDQLVPVQLFSDHVRPSHGLPKMSCSPLSSTSLSITWAEPRAASSDPSPLAVG
jgi:hypothetical protein